MAERKSSKKKVVEKSVEASLWESANKLRGSVEPAEYNTLATLEQNAGALYRHTFVDNIDPNNLPEGWRMGTVGVNCGCLYLEPNKCWINDNAIKGFSKGLPIEFLKHWIKLPK